jgi:hypothetical protein
VVGRLLARSETGQSKGSTPGAGPFLNHISAEGRAVTLERLLVELLAPYGGLTIVGAVLGVVIEAASRLGLSRRAISIIQGIVFTVVAVLLGFLGLPLFFADGPSLSERFVVAAIAYPLFGFVTGYFNTRAWMIAGLAAWGPMLLGILSLISQLSVLALGLLLLPLGLVLLGGYVGSRFRRRRQVSSVTG